MFTQSAPAIVNALSGALPEQAVKALVQALGNCQQPLTHRGDVLLSPTEPPNNNGVLSGGRWNPRDYQNLFGPGFQLNIEAPSFGGFSTGSFYNTNYGGAQFSFPTNQEFASNAYYGGPTLNVGGNSYFQNSFSTNAYHQNASVQNLFVENINNYPVDGQPGGNTTLFGGDSFFVTEENLAIFIDDSDSTNIYGGKPRRREIIDYVDVAGSVEVPYTYGATLDEDCKIKLDIQPLVCSLDLRVRTDTSRLSYMSPISLDTQQ